MRKDLGLTDVTVGIVASSLLIGAAFGAFIGGRSSDWFGRKRTLIILSLFFILGTVGSSMAPGYYVMIPFRVVLGLAVGGASVTVPVFLAELSPANLRGQIVTRNEFMIVSGQLVAFVINAILGTIWSSHDGIWRWMQILAVLPALGLLAGLLAAGVPESPRWLIAEQRFEEALAVLRKIRKTEAQALEELAEVLKTAQEDQQTTLGDVLAQGWLRRCLLIGVGVAMCNQLAGVNSIMYYGTELLARTGLETDAALVANIANGLVSVLATGIGIWLLGRLGRRPMLMAGQLGTVFAHLLIGTCSLVVPEGKARGFAILALTVTFLLFQQGGISPVTWLMQSEMFPLRVRGLAMGLSTFVLWLVNFLIGLCFPILIGAIGISTTFFIFALIGLVALLFVWGWMPETKGKTLEELERQFHAEDMEALRQPGNRKRGLNDGIIRGSEPKERTTTPANDADTNEMGEQRRAVKMA